MDVLTDEKKIQVGYTRDSRPRTVPNIEDFEKILMPVFGDKLSVSK